MALTIDGNSLVFTGTLTVTNFTNPANGVCTLVLTPEGGVGTLPALLAGDPGLPPDLAVGTVTTLSPGENATFTLTKTADGGAGIANAYTIDVGLPQGEKGNDGQATILAATDIENTPTDTYLIAYDGPNNKAQWVPQRVGPLKQPSNIESSSGSSSTRTLASLNIDAQPFDWRPLVWGHCVVVGTENTTVNLLCRLNDNDTGDIVAQCDGLPGTDRPVIHPGFDSTIGADYGKVNAGESATLYFIAEQVNSTVDSWTTNKDKTSFTVMVHPLQPGQ